MASSTGVFAKGTQPGGSNRCGTPHMTPEQVHNYNILASQSMNKLDALKTSAQKTGGSSIQKVEIEDLREKEIKVYVHVLANGTKVEDGYLEVSCPPSNFYGPSLTACANHPLPPKRNPKSTNKSRSSTPTSAPPSSPSASKTFPTPSIRPGPSPRTNTASSPPCARANTPTSTSTSPSPSPTPS